MGLVDHALERIETLNPRINAFVAIDAEAARAGAQRIDDSVAAGADPGPLAGIPIGVKDLEHATGFVTTYGSPLHGNDAPSTVDSVLVGRLKGAGAIVVGKTNTPEFGHKGTTDNELFGSTANPWNLEQTPGGSSGGSGAALASGMVPLATGSDGGGSIRIPSALCGLTGLKCQQGRIGGHIDGASAAMLLSVVGPMARTASDTAWALDAVRGPHWADPFSLPVDERSWFEMTTNGDLPSRVVWSPTMGFAEVDPDIAARCQAAVDRFEAAGTEVIVDDTVFEEKPLPGWATNWFLYLHKRLGHHHDTPEWGKISPMLQTMIELGAEIDSAEAADGLQQMFARNHDVGSVLERHEADLLLTPSLALLPPTLAQIDAGDAELGWVEFTFSLNMTRHPAGSVCVGRVGDLPVGLQVIGRHFDEPGVLAAMAAIEGLVDPIGRPAGI